MFSVFGEVIKRFYISQHKTINVDNCVAKLHYRITFWLLIACCSIVCSRQYVGDRIRCLVDGGVPSSVVNTFCYSLSTYTLYREPTKSTFDNRSTSQLYAHPGVSSYSDDAIMHQHKYYQWVPWVLFAQALLFVIPHHLWKSFEKGVIRDMVEGLQRVYLSSSITNIDIKLMNGYEIHTTKSIADIADKLSEQFLRRRRFHLNYSWSMRLISCEFLNFLNVIANLYLLNAFLGGNFIGLGYRIMKNDPHDNPFEIVFPKVTKCDFYKYGPSGSMQKYDAMCVMALNIIHEKIYAVLWFWFLFLLYVSMFVLMWRTASFVLHSKSKYFNYLMIRNTLGVEVNSNDLALVTKRFLYWDWLFMSYLGSNVDAVIFQEFLRRLGNELNISEGSTTWSDLVDDEKKSPNSRKKLESQSMITLSPKEDGMKSSNV